MKLVVYFCFEVKKPCSAEEGKLLSFSQTSDFSRVTPNAYNLRKQHVYISV